jgi:hypothetical protein
VAAAGGGDRGWGGEETSGSRAERGGGACRFCCRLRSGLEIEGVGGGAGSSREDDGVWQGDGKKERNGGAHI